MRLAGSLISYHIGCMVRCFIRFNIVKQIRLSSHQKHLFQWIQVLFLALAFYFLKLTYVSTAIINQQHDQCEQLLTVLSSSVRSFLFLYFDFTTLDPYLSNIYLCSSSKSENANGIFEVHCVV